MLWIVGEGDLRSQLERTARRVGVSRHVTFWGQIPDFRKAELLGRSRCLVLPSRGEGFGLVYLEAMRIGRPCLVSGLDGGTEVVNPPEAGLAADPGRPSELVGAMSRLLARSGEWARWSVAARERYQRYYTSVHFGERLVDALMADERVLATR
jgi:phosphatidylinositol alpha-1,6-mannosyltransferase